MTSAWRWSLFCVIGVAMLFLGYILGRPPAGESAPPSVSHPTDAPSPAMEDLARRVGVLATTVEALRSAMRKLLAREPGPTTPAVVAASSGRDPTVVPTAADGSRGKDEMPLAANDVSAPIGPDETLQETLAFEQRLVDAYDAHLAQDPPDPNWSWGMERELAQSVRPASMGEPRVLRLTCGSTMCAIRLAFRDLEARRAFDRGVRRTAPWTELGEGFFRARGLDDLEMEVYVARHGHQFPQVASEAEEESP